MIKAKINQIRRAHFCALFVGHKFIGQTCHSTFLKNTTEGKMVVLHLYLQGGQKTGGLNDVRILSAHFFLNWLIPWGRPILSLSLQLQLAMPHFGKFSQTCTAPKHQCQDRAFLHGQCMWLIAVMQACLPNS